MQRCAVAMLRHLAAGHGWLAHAPPCGCQAQNNNGVGPTPTPHPIPTRPPTTLITTPAPTRGLQALIGSLARADELPAALPVLDAWLQQQEDSLADDEHTHAPLQVPGCFPTGAHSACALMCALAS